VLSSSAESVPAILIAPSSEGSGTGPCCDSSYRGGVCARTHTCMINYVGDGELYHHLLGATSTHTNTKCFCMSFMYNTRSSQTALLHTLLSKMKLPSVLAR